MKDRPIPLRSVDASVTISSDIDASFDKINDVSNSKVLPIFKSSKVIKPKKITTLNKTGEQLKEVLKINSVESSKFAADIDEVKAFITNDRDLLDQYYELRHTAYRKENGWRDFNGYESDFDRNGRIVVAVNSKGEVIGGMRLMFSDEYQYLSNEIPGTEFTYQKIIGKYDKREGLVFSEISAIVVAKSYRDRSITSKLFDCLIKESVSHKCDYMFGVAIAVVCRDYRIIFKTLGYYVEILINYPWKQKQTYNYMKMFPMYTKL